MKIRKRLDGWINTLKGLGGLTDKSQATEYTQSKVLTNEEIEALYDGDWLARRICNALPEAAYRQRFEIESDETMKRFLELNHTQSFPRGILSQAQSIGRAYGGSAILLGYKNSGQDLTKPPGRNAELAWLDILKLPHLYVLKRFENPNSEYYGQPEIFKVTRGRRQGLEIHVDRLILCEGVTRLSDFETIYQYQSLTGSQTRYWTAEIFPEWQSILQTAYEALNEYGMSWKAISTLIQEASIGKLTMAGVIQMLASENKDAIETRLELLSQSRSVTKTMLLDADADEDFSREPVNFSGVPQLAEQIAKRIAGAAGMPVTVLFKQSPDGMNATGESDLTQWYDDIHEYRVTSSEPKILRILKAIDGKDHELTWPSLWAPTEKEKAEQDGKTLESIDKLFNMSAIDSNEARSMARDSVETFEVPKGPVPEEKENPTEPLPFGEEEGEGEEEGDEDGDGDQIFAALEANVED